MTDDIPGSSAVQAMSDRVAVLGHMTDAHVLSTLLIEMLSMVPADALRAARQTPGVLPRRMSHAQAEELVEKLVAFGVRAVTVVAEQLPDIAHPHGIHHALCQTEGLEFLDYTGTREAFVHWNEIAVIAVGQIPGEARVRAVDRGRPSVVSSAPLPRVDTVSTVISHVLELWLLPARPHESVYHLRHDRFNYECLGTARSSQAVTNFHRLLDLLRVRASQAHLTPATRAYLDRHLTGYDFPSMDELKNQALVTWVIREQMRTADFPALLRNSQCVGPEIQG